MVLGREQILTVVDITRELVEVPEWGGEVYVTAMSGMERDAWEASLFSNKDGESTQNLENMRARLCAITIVDESGNRLFTDKEAKELGKKSAKALDRVFKVAQRLNGIGAESVDVAEKN
jgi:hypothetical protein